MSVKHGIYFLRYKLDLNTLSNRIAKYRAQIKIRSGFLLRPYQKISKVDNSFSKSFKMAMLYFTSEFTRHIEDARTALKTGNKMLSSRQKIKRNHVVSSAALAFILVIKDCALDLRKFS